MHNQIVKHKIAGQNWIYAVQYMTKFANVETLQQSWIATDYMQSGLCNQIPN